LKEIDRRDALIISQKQVQALQRTKVDRKIVSDPFFKLESAYYDYIAGFTELLEELSQDKANTFVKNYSIVTSFQREETEQLNIALSFSPFLNQCKHDIEVVLGLRISAIWGKWDLLLQWAEWTKNGISPGNQPFEHNLSRLFASLKISEATQSCGLFLLERLASMKAVITDKEACLKALELYLDKQEQYWIIAHVADGVTSKPEPYFIKKLQQGSQPFMLLKLLIEARPYSEFPNFTHTLGELEIKKELKKVFFPQDEFAGSLVRINEIIDPINTKEILDDLVAIKQAKKHSPLFQLGPYFSSLASRK
jgi:hypothetical protein